MTNKLKLVPNDVKDNVLCTTIKFTLSFRLQDNPLVLTNHLKKISSQDIEPYVFITVYEYTYIFSYI